MEKTRRISAAEVVESRFYQLPKWLVSNEQFKGLNSDAKILYAIMRDRHDLSLKNNWVDEDGNIYMIYTRQNMSDDLGVTEKTVTKSVNELKKYKLIDEVRQGCNKPNLLYLLTVSIDSQLTRKNSVSENVNIPYPNTEILRANDTDIIDTNKNYTKKEISTTGADKSAVVSDNELIILKDTNIKTLTAHQKKKVSSWEVSTLIKAIAIYNQLGGQYFKLLEKIYLDGAKDSLIKKPNTLESKNKAFTTTYTHNWDLEQLDEMGGGDLDRYLGEVMPNKYGDN